jgi:hypothetical protein
MWDEFRDLCQSRGIFLPEIPENPEPMYKIVQGMALEVPVEAYVTGVVLSWEEESNNYLVRLPDASLGRFEECKVNVPKVNPS